MHSLSIVLIITFLFAKEGNDDKSRFFEGAEKAPWLAKSGLTHREEARKHKRSSSGYPHTEGCRAST